MAQIYCITDKTTNKKYIGQTTQLLGTRFNQHCVCGKTRISREIQAKGRDNFTIETIVTCNETELAELEKHFISSLNTLYPNGYNETTGGAGITGYSHTIETKKYLAESTSKYMSSMSEEDKEAHSKKVSAGLKGVPKSEEHKKSLSKARLGVTPTNKGVPMSEEQKLKLSVANKGKVSPRRIPLMCTGNGVEKRFNSYMDASEWLIDSGYTKSRNRTSVTSTIKESVSTGNKRYGFVWSVIE